MKQVRARVGGALRSGDAWDEVTNPYDSGLIARVPSLGAPDVDEACRAAQRALRRRDFPQHARAAVLDRAAALLDERRAEFVTTISLEAGKPVTASRVEVARCVDTLRFAAAEARRLCGEMVPMDASDTGVGRLGLALRVPVGVVAAISPFNFPLNLVAHKLAPAVAAGCPVVLKPAEDTPLSAIRLVDLLIEAGLPADWVSVLTGTGPDVGQPLVLHPIPRLVSFTGSVPVGRVIAREAADKRVALELGSNAPVIVEPDSDLDDVAARLRVAGYAFAGQSCISTQRVLVHRAVHDELVDRLEAEVAEIVVGDPLDEATEVGPLIRPAETERVCAWIDDAASGGARVVAGGTVQDGVLGPTLVDEPPPDSHLVRREVFGPVLAVQAYETFDQAVELANDSDFGLQVGVFTRDVGLALRAVRDLDFGGVLVNEVPTFRADQQPYGGVRDSGNTREGPAYAVEEMTDLRFALIGA